MRRSEHLDGYHGGIAWTGGGQFDARAYITVVRRVPALPRPAQPEPVPAVAGPYRRVWSLDPHIGRWFLTTELR